MTILDLVALLKKLPPDMPVYKAGPSYQREVEDAEDLPFEIQEGRLYIEVYDTYIVDSVDLSDYLDALK